jgi:hypothetical protein
MMNGSKLKKVIAKIAIRTKLYYLGKGYYEHSVFDRLIFNKVR